MPGADVYPFVFTTYRLTEHHTAGGMSRWTPYLSELQPEMFCEISPQLAAERGLSNEGWATIISPRGAIEARVLVTDRMRPLTINGPPGGTRWAFRTTGASAPTPWSAATPPTTSSGVTLDPNVQIQESKVGSCDVIAGRRPPQGAALIDLVRAYQERAGVTTETDNQHITGKAEE